ncbi:MAG: hydrogenase iron-sulfur subunit [Thermoplasmata archaeon]|nr:MAG: hydrogenase iron-sulfur subunit [Thermoplasmata archaeon]
MKKFEPVIVGFVCNECVYAAADLAGTTRLSYPPNIRLIRVPCSGQVDIIHILRAFENGADGVFVGGCLPEQCHYVDGNIKAEKRVEFLKKALMALGLEEERLSIHLLSAAMGIEFANFAGEFTNTIKKLGPNPLKNQKSLSLHSNHKRMIMRDLLLSISDAFGKEGVKFQAVFPGFGEAILDENKCIGCGACSYVCKDEAMTTAIENDVILINNTYWKCTACGRCQEICPKDCMEIREEFDLKRFLKGEVDQKAEVGMLACERCNKPFLPLMMAADIEKILTDKAQSTDFVGLCPTCKKFHQAEKVRAISGFGGNLKGIEALKKVSKQKGRA